MAKKSYFTVFGVKNGKGIQALAQFDERKDANWHVKNTFHNLGLDHLLVKKTGKKDTDVYVKPEDAEIRESFAATSIFMKSDNWDVVHTSSSFDTLLGFLHTGKLDRSSQLGKLSDVSKEDDTYTISVIQNSNDAIPLDKVKATLSKAILDDFLGDETEDDEDDESEEDEEVEEVVEDTPKKEVEEVKEETPVEEVDEEVEEIIEDEVEPTVEEPVLEVVEEVVTEEPKVEEVVEEEENEVVEEPKAESEVSLDEVVEEEEKVEEVVEEPTVETEVDLDILDVDDIEDSADEEEEEEKDTSLDNLMDEFDL